VLEEIRNQKGKTMQQLTGLVTVGYSGEGKPATVKFNQKTIAFDDTNCKGEIVRRTVEMNDALPEPEYYRQQDMSGTWYEMLEWWSPKLPARPYNATCPTFHLQTWDRQKGKLHIWAKWAHKDDIGIMRETGAEMNAIDLDEPSRLMLVHMLDSAKARKEQGRLL